jgi:EmrB/QacA subfamily drug resistance transporter
LTSFTKLPSDEAAVLAAPAAAPCTPAAAPWILAATILASSMAFIDGTVANIALPALQREFNATVFDAQWVIESFALFLSALLLVGGAAGDRFGRRRVFAIGVALFTAASVWCGLASSVRELIVARAVQGIGGALLVPGSLSIISASFAESERGKAIGTWSGYSAITTAIGPVLGGYLIDHLSWRYAFLINLPIGAAVLALTYWHVPESRNPASAAGVDWAGAALASVGLGGVVYALIESSVKGWGSPAIVSALVLGVAALIAFVFVERRHPAPMLPLDLFRSRNFAAANTLTLLLYAALGGSLFFLPLNLIQVQGYSTTQAGAAFLPFVLCLFLLSRWAGGLVNRYGAKLPLVVGPALAGVGFLSLALPGIGGGYWVTFFPGVLVLGLGMAVTVAPLTTVVMGSVGPQSAGAASGVNNAVSRVAALLAIALLGIVMAQAFNRTLEQRLATLPLPPEAVQAVESQRDKLAGIELPPDIEPQARNTLQRAIGESFVNGYRAVMILGALLAFASAGLALMRVAATPSPSGRGSG